MRIGMVTTGFPRWDGDVAGIFVLGLARSLAARGHEISVLAPAPSVACPPPAWPGVDVEFVRYLWPRALQRTFYGAGAPDNLRRDPGAVLGAGPFTAALYAALRRRRSAWDALISHWLLPCGLVGALGFAGRHLSVVHSADLHLLSALPFRRLLAAQLVYGSDHIMFVAESKRRSFLEMLPDRTRPTAIARSSVQAMGVDVDPATDPPLRKVVGGRFTLLSIARLVPVKGLPAALRALRERGDLRWRIVGDGPERATLAMLARGAAIELELYGTLTGQPKLALLREAQAFLLPSLVLPSGRSEGAPAALLEAMACGLPVIAADVGGVRELVAHDRTGLLYDPSDHQAMIGAIDRLRGDHALRQRLAAAGESFARRFHWPRVAARVEQLLVG